MPSIGGSTAGSLSLDLPPPPPFVSLPIWEFLLHVDQYLLRSCPRHILMFVLLNLMHTDKKFSQGKILELFRCRIDTI